MASEEPSRRKRRPAILGLRTAREFAQLTQQQLAKESGVTATTIGDLETKRNNNPSHEKVTKIIRVLKKHGLPRIKAEDIFKVKDEPS